MLKGKKKSVTELDYGDVDKSIAKFLLSKKLPLMKGYSGPEYVCVAAEEWSNDSDHHFSVEAAEPSEYDMEEFKTGSYSFCTGTILDWMCFDGKIEPGEYNVSVCW